MAELGKVIALKCPNCGATLDEDSQLSKCKYCGMTVRIEDAYKYLEYLKGFIVEWMRTALPLGVGVTAVSSVDALARHNIFVYNILPRLKAEFGLLETNSYEVFSKPLIVPPFVKYPLLAKQFGDPKTFFTYDAKIAAIQPFAITKDDQTDTAKMGGMALALAHVLIGLENLSQNEISKFKLTAENFGMASKALGSQNEVLSMRLQALNKIYLSMDDLYSNNLINARSKIEEAKTILQQVKEKSAFDINLSLCTAAIEQEIETANAVLQISDTMETIGYGDSLKTLNQMGKLFQAASSLPNSVPSVWRNRFENVSRYFDIAKLFSRVLEAKNGRPSIKTTGGEGTILFPFWVAEVRYNFGTGALWMKKGVSVAENALVAATFPLVENFAASPSDVVTDIFSSRPSGSITSSIVGSETSISHGAQVAGLVRSTRAASGSGYMIVPPLSTSSEAKQLFGEYLQRVSGQLQGKLQVASCEITDLVFVPADLGAGFISFSRSLGYLQPRRVGDVTQMRNLLV